MKIIADDKIPFLRGALEPYADVVYLDGSQIDSSHVADADAIVIRTRTRCNAQLLDNSAVKSIFTATIGFDHIDLDYCRRRGIFWQNAPGCNSCSVQQYMASALACLHAKGRTLAGSTIAIVGVGNVGSKVDEWARLLGMNVLQVDPVRADNEGGDAFCDYFAALRQADIVSFHTPLTYSGKYPTHHLFNAEALAQLKRGAVVANTSRGEVIDTEMLLCGLDDGTISDVIIDVWETEPNINRRLLERAFIATPHVAGYSADSKRNGTLMSVTALCRHYGIGNGGWQPGLLPPPTQGSHVDISAEASAEDAACQMFLHTYNIMSDVRALKSAPETFETLRGHYPLRREIGAFDIDPNAPHAGFLRQFGIKLK